MTSLPRASYDRILLKLSGAALLGNREFGISGDILAGYAREITSVVHKGVQVAIVIGGGNIFRGVQGAARGMKRAHGDYMGMLATMINAMALQDALEKEDVDTRLLSSIKMEEIAEPFIRRRAIRHLEKGRVVIFGTGTGNPYFTTDTAAALRALEVEAQILIKGTRVNGIYSEDPEIEPSAQHYARIHGNEVIRKDLRVMDMTAFTLCKESSLPVIVFNVNSAGDLSRIIRGEPLGTFVYWG